MGGSLFGIMGMVLGVPLAATIYKLYFQDLESKEAAMGIPLPDSEEEVMIAPSKPVMKKKRTKKK